MVCARVKNKKWAVQHRQLKRAYFSVWYRENVETQRLRTREWIKGHPELHRAGNKRWTAKHPEQSKQIRQKCVEANPEKYHQHKTNADIRRRARIKPAGTYTLAEWKALKDAYGNRCANPECGNPTAPLTVDHVVPLSVGGSNLISNLQPLCWKCNNAKRTKTIRYRPIFET
jgi:5-methylcytosine-specific restriction endonuclease McrA